jgi:F0F1-type ATP synthase beta subunit
VYVPVEESIRGFKEILEGKHDDLPERAFFLKGTIDDVVKEARGDSGEDEKQSEEDKGDDEGNGDE